MIAKGVSNKAAVRLVKEKSTAADPDIASIHAGITKFEGTWKNPYPK